MAKPPEKHTELGKAAEVTKAPEMPADFAEPEPKRNAEAKNEDLPTATSSIPSEKVAEPPAPVQTSASESATTLPTPSSVTSSGSSSATRFGIEIGTVEKRGGLQPLWRDILTKHAALVSGLQARRMLAPDKKWRLIAGPFGSIAEAKQACGIFSKAGLKCEATAFADEL
jgi:hypothetical protein